MPNDFQEHLDEPTFSKVLDACKRRGVRVTVTVRDGASITCRTEMSGNAASIDFDLWRLGSNFSEEAQRRYTEKHDAYLKKHLKQLRPKKPGIASHFGATGIRFQVLDQDASEWFDDVYAALQDTANFTPLPDPFEMLKKAKRPANPEAKKKPSFPNAPPAESPRMTALRTRLRMLQRPTQPKTPETLKAIQRVLKTYERPSAITKYVKQTRGSTCQLCGYRGFKKWNGKLYCEIHHLFHLSKNPPPMCLGLEYLVVLCATCHRRMHYADVGELTRDKKGWRVSVDGDEVVFEVSDR
jgi:5-methylcytosine-specific restriction endonuclease McrA